MESGACFIVAVIISGIFIYLIFVREVEWGKKEVKAEQEAELRRKKAEQEAFEKYESVRKDYEAALDDLEAEDCKQNRIKALEKGREWCATSREYAHGNKSVTVVDEVSITNDINARTCD